MVLAYIQLNESGSCFPNLFFQTQVNTMCPTLLPFNYLIHTNVTYEENPLVIKAKGLGNFTREFEDGNFECVIRYSDRELFRTGASLVSFTNGRNEVHCVQTRVRDRSLFYTKSIIVLHFLKCVYNILSNSI